MQDFDAAVLVVGLGPVGSVAALSLARRGIDVIAVEAGPAGAAADLRASTFHAPTLEMLDAIGAADAILDYGLKAMVYQYRDRQSGETFSLDLGELADVTRYPFRLQCEQHRMAHDVADKLEREPSAQIDFAQRLLYLEQDESGVTAHIETPTSVRHVRARYVIGADGASSVVRKVLALDFPGWTHADKYLCLSTEYPLETVLPGLCHVNYISDPDEWMVLLRTPNLWRILVPAEETGNDAELLSDANKNAVFRRMLGSDVDITTQHRTIYRVHQRVVSSFVQGRVCLVGDAAHLNSPMGGFGMNSGIHDAVNLTGKLAAILQEGAAPELVAQYDRQRRTVTNGFIQAQSIENTEMMRNGWSGVSGKRRATLRALMSDPAARRAYLLRQSMFTSLADAAQVA